MHIQVAQTFNFAPTVEVAVPHQGEFTGDVYGPSEVPPFARRSTIMAEGP